MPSVSAHVALTLASHANHVFGVMGNGNAYFLDALVRQTDVGYTAARHEAGAVFAADAHFRAGGGLAIATTTYGAGFTNTITALAEAVQARVPLVLVVGDEPTSGPRPWDVDQIGMAAAVGARTYTVGLTDAAATTAIAVEHALRYQVPTVLAIPYDVARVEAGPVPETAPIRPLPPLAPRGEFTEATLQEVAQALATAERPFLLGGRGAWLSGAGQALGQLADLTHAVTASSALGRGLFPRSEFDLGVAGGFGAPAAMDLVRTADVAVVFGASLNQFTMRFGELFAPGTRVIQVDTAATATHPYVGSFIRGDAAVVAADLAARVKSLQAAEHDAAGEFAPDVQGTTPLATGWREGLDFDALRQHVVEGEFAQDGRLDPRAVAARLGELLPQDRVVVSDGGHFLGWANMYWDVKRPDNMVMVGTAYQTIGTGFSSMPGAGTARPEATVVLTTGDGGGLMALADLETAVRTCAGRGLAVVWNDAAYGAEVNLYGVLGLERSPMLIPEVSFTELAEAFGGRGVLVRSLTDLDVLKQWNAQPADERPFLLLDMRISDTIIAPHQYEVIAQNR
ncbi:thiamine pyrophosphate-binding protein [Galactobacter caseinivorans]|uniref:Thiamine pyrophosphate-binding protein n=1 Tax=Galactobacter caseinivorans TaxID=2676123 RepID=A0A496PLL2_9MICC|nr:thiamine pyrophosphate-binding protein [Galactobacter caseinivorans]RKW71415.1 thiamine pyrophosphate-binding protein [Galactobacter caseinivorans]